MEADLLVLGHVLLLQAARVHNLLRLIYVNAVHLLTDLGLILLDELSNVGDVVVVGLSQSASVHRGGLLTAATQVTSDLQVSVSILILCDHLKKDGGGDTVAGLAVLFLEIHTHHMNGVPGADFHGSTLDLLFHEETAAETCDISVEQIH